MIGGEGGRREGEEEERGRGCGKGVWVGAIDWMRIIIWIYVRRDGETTLKKL